MAYDSLRSFIQKLEEQGELRRIGFELDPVLEITELADREMKKPDGGKALLVENPKGSEFPLLINAFGSRKRMAMALGVGSVEQIAAELAGLMKAKPPASLKQALALLGQFFELRHTKPKTVATGPCKEVIHKAGDGFSLDRLPILKCWPKDGGRFITLPVVITKDPDTGERNLGMYRMQVLDGWKTAMHWQLHKIGARHGRRAAELKRNIPVAVCLGGDPVYTFAAVTPLPDGLDEILFSGFLRKKSVELVRCETNELEVPADCDFVLEGYVDANKFCKEGPFGDHTGYYTPEDDYPVFQLTAITHRRDPIYPATIVGVPPMEDYYIGEAIMRIFLPVFRLNFPEIVEMHLPAEGVLNNWVIVSIKKQYPWHAFKICHGLWGMGQMMFTKLIMVVDADVDVHNLSEVMFRVCANVDPQRDTIFTRGPADSLDHAPNEPNIGTKMGIDATHKLPGEGYRRGWPELIRMDPAVKKRVDDLLAKGNSQD